MVAELAGISVSNTEQKSLGRSGSCDDDNNGIKKKKLRPKWIERATREPIYSVLDNNNINEIQSNNKRCLNSSILNSENIVVICPINSEKERKYSEVTIAAQQKELPSSSSCLYNLEKKKEEEEEAIYSVVIKKPFNKTRQRESDNSEILIKQREVNNWLKTDMYSTPLPHRQTDEESKFEYEWRRDVNRGAAGPFGIARGIVGLVGPYRVYPDPNERREYILREEELIEDIVDSVSQIASGEKPDDDDDKNLQEEQPEGEEDEELRIEEMCVKANEQPHHQRAKWKIRDDDEETLVPDLPDLNNWKENSETADIKIPADGQSDGNNFSGGNCILGRENWKMRESDNIVARMNAAEKNSIILHGKHERAVDVPDGASNISSTLKNQLVNNENQDKDSLNETGSTTGGAVEGNPGGNPSGGGGIRDGVPSAVSASPPPRSLVSRILARARSPHDLLDHAEPFSQLWVVLSNVYGELVVVLMLAFCLAEVMDTPVPLHSLQGVFLMYLYVGSIAVIISIYLWVLIDSCSSMSNGSNGIEDAELGGASLTRFGSLKRAHISRTRTAPTSFYIRVGALLFGLATLVFNGLEMAMHSMMQGDKCHNEIVFVHPVLHGLFTFLQMHFLFVNSQVLVERFGLIARFGFTHLAATNIAVWARLVIWDSAQEWTYLVHLVQQQPDAGTSPLNLRGFPGSVTRHVRDLLGESLPENAILNPYQPISEEQISQVVDLHDCLNTNTLGRLWTSSVPFLYPFIVQFSLIAAAVTYVMGQNVGRNRLSHKQKFHVNKDLTTDTRIGCDGSSKGLFLGILCMVAGIVVIIIFLVVKDDKNFPLETLSWLTCGTPIGILALSGVMTASGLVQVRQMSVVTRAPATLDGLLSTVALFGVQLYSVFTIVVAACSLATTDEKSEQLKARYIVLLVVSALQLLQCCAQSTLIAEASKRSCITRFQMMAKPARQVITFLLFSNAVLWAFDTVVTQSWLSQELQLRFFGVLAWGVISRIGLPLLVFYRFHSCVLLLEAWNKCYRMPRGEHPLN